MSIENWEHELLQAAGIDPEGPVYQLAGMLAEADDNLLEALVRTRVALGLSQEEVAKRMNRSVETVKNFETLGADPRLSTIRRYAGAVGVKVGHSSELFIVEPNSPEAQREQPC